MTVVRALCFASLCLLLALPVKVAAQAATPVITSPVAGQVLSGPVAITGATDIPNFASTEVSFAYAADSTNTWFRISATTQPVSNDVLASWDTTTISDGDYILRVRVTLQDGTFQDATVNVQVRNYSSIATATAVPPTPTLAALQIPTAIVVADTPTFSAPAILPFSTPTPLPANPAAVTSNEIYLYLQRGALAIGILFFLFGITLRLRRN